MSKYDLPFLNDKKPVKTSVPKGANKSTVKKTTKKSTKGKK